MKKITLSELPLNERDDSLRVKGVYSCKMDDKVIRFGNVVYPAGVRNPAEGIVGHEGYEITLFLKGGAQLITEEATYDVKAGDVTVAGYGEAHATLNNTQEDCETFYIMIEKIH